jgi:competence protein ComEA
MLVCGASIAANRATTQLTGTVNVNTATAQELMLLPGIGKVKADAVVSYRQVSPFKSVADLVKVQGIGDKLLSKIQQYVTLDGPTTAKVIKLPAQQVQQTAQATNVSAQQR